MSQSINQIQFPPAPIVKRTLAAICDFTLLYLPTWMVLIYKADVIEPLWQLFKIELSQGQTGDGSFAEVMLLNRIQTTAQASLWIIILITWGYYGISGCIFQGGTIGKKIFNLRVLKLPQSKPLSFLDNIFRSGVFTFFLMIRTSLLLPLNFLWMCFHKQHRSLHDLCCRTYVINCKTAEQGGKTVCPGIPSNAKESK